ncbi:MAG: tripartite tricarboxylate transporter substrate binding protein [Clostridiales bacterium]|nr:tripartite tricarboxylate transporter substrate binding protein [Clostridiales bacterium]
MKLKKVVTMILAVSMAASLAACGSSSKETASAPTKDAGAESSVNFPTQNVNGIVQWGEGGGTDSLMRPLATLAQDKLGKSIVVQNMTGGTGSIATQYVYDQDADGYNLLMGAENPSLYDALDILDLTYENFECVFLIGDETTGVAVGKDSPYESLTDICEAALAGEEITLATTGTGGLPWEVASLITAETGATFTQIQYDSDASARVAVLGGECDFTICKVQSCLEEYKAGDLKLLCMLATETVEQMPDVPLIAEEYPGFADYLPWGPFYGVFVKEGTDPAVISVLSDAFKAAYEDASYQEVLANYNINPMGYTGDEAKAYLDSWRENTISALTKAGAIE